VRRGWSRLVGAFDVLFIMLLCFATLLATMLGRGKVLVGEGAGEEMGYAFTLPAFLAVLLGLALYLLFVVLRSNRELRRMIGALYDGEPAEKPEKKEKR
jgi:hypothetical protein